MNRSVLAAGIIATAIALAVTGCGKAKKGGGAETIPVRVMTVTHRDMQRALDYTGNIKGRDEAVVYPKVSGKIIEKVKEDGSPISKGEALAYIDRDEVGLTFEKAPVESPLAGTVGRIYVDIGSNVTPQTPVGMVTDMSRTEIDLDIPEMYLPQIRIGQPARVTVDAHPGEVFTGVITRISPVVDLGTRTAPIEIDIDNPDAKLQSGMFAKVSLSIEERPGVPAILKESIIGKAPDTYVYTVRDGTAHLTKVTLGIRQGPIYEVLDGIREGDQVVVMGQQRLREGSRVRVEE